MQYRKLGKSGLEVSVVGIGGWAVGGHLQQWGPVDDNETIAAIREGIELGINFIDTAPAYGYGHSEEIIGRAIAGLRDKVVVATKCGLLWRERGGKFERNLRPESIRRECEASLRRLRIETIDLYQLHYPDPQTPVAASLEALQQLRSEGRIRAIGVSNFSVEQLAEVRRNGFVESVQPEFSLLDRAAADDLLPYCAEYGIAVLTYASLGKGLLTGKFDAASRLTDVRAADPLFQGDRFRRNLALVEDLRQIAAHVGKTPAQVALRWVIQQRGVTSAVAGIKRASQARENAAAGQFELSNETLEQLDALATKEA